MEVGDVGKSRGLALTSLPHPAKAQATLAGSRRRRIASHSHGAYVHVSQAHAACLGHKTCSLAMKIIEDNCRPHDRSMGDERKPISNELITTPLQSLSLRHVR